MLSTFGKASLVMVLALALCADPSWAARGGGGGGGGRSFGGGASGGRSFGGGEARSFGGYSSAARTGGGQFDRAGFNGTAFNSAARSNYGNYYNGHGYAGRGWGGGWGWGGLGWGWGGYWPWLAGWGWGWGYPYGGYNYYYPDNDSYYYSYAPTGYSGASGDSASPMPPQNAPGPPLSSAISTTAEDQQGVASEGLEYYSQAREAFAQGDYQSALRLGGHAAVDAPSNPKVHELVSLALFALGNYNAAASEAHAAMALGPIADWKDLYSYYNNVEKYTAQLRALEKASSGDAKSAADHFLLGYHYLMTGAKDNAKTELSEAVKITANDKLANHYLKELESNAPLTPPQLATRPNGESR